MGRLSGPRRVSKMHYSTTTSALTTQREIVANAKSTYTKELNAGQHRHTTLR